MRRILQVELDENYFDQFGEAFFKSFYYYNKRWDLHITDLGLSSAQRKLLSRYGEIHSRPRDCYRRYGQLSARVATWAEIVKDDDLILHMDVDGVVLDSFEAEVQEFVKDEYDISGCTWNLPLRDAARYSKGANEMLGVTDDDIFTDRSRIHAGWLLLRGNSQMHDALCWLRDNWEQYSIYTTEEESALSSIVYHRKLKLKGNMIVDCPKLNPESGCTAAILPSLQPPNRIDNGRSRFIHFAICKYFMTNAAGGETRECYLAWCDNLLQPYKELPWPEPGDVCESR